MMSKSNSNKARSTGSKRGPAQRTRETPVSAINDRQIGRPTYRPFSGNAEYKVSDVTTTSSTIGSSGTLFHLNPIGQGTDTNQRIGNEYIMKAFNMRYSFATTGQTTAADETNVFRLIVLYDKQSKGSAPAVADILSLPRPDSTFQDSQKGRFIVLYDYYGYVGLNSHMVHCDSILERIDLQVVCNATGSTISSIVTGAVYMLCISDSTIVPNPVLNFNTRVAYTDS